MGNTITADWVAVDWGMTSQRAWAMSHDGLVLAEIESDRGNVSRIPAPFETALLSMTAEWLGADQPTPVLCCSRAGAHLGWSEAPYRAAPTQVIDPAHLVEIPTRESRVKVLVVAGVKQARPPDIMNGEETTIAGFLNTQPDFDGVLCLPGRHTKWARISAGELVSFTSFMTGELFGLLAGQTVLRLDVNGGGWDDAAFDDAVSVAQSHPARIAADLFSIHAASVIADLPAAAARARLSGLLIGQEITAAKPYWLGMEVVILGEEPLASLYQRALNAQGLTATIRPANAATLNGLRAFWMAYRKGDESV